MNIGYSHDKARTYLKSLYEVRVSDPCVPFVSDLDLEAVKIQTLKYPPSIRIMSVEKGEEIEVTVKMQGVLCSKVLPPLTYKPSTKTMSHIRNLRQHVKITALGLPEFGAELEAIHSAVKVFKNHVPTQNVTHIDFLPYEGDPSLEAHARYFTDRNLVPFAKNSPFGPDVDTNGILKSIQPDAFIHGPDNYVKYCRLHAEEGGEMRHVAFNPSLFKAGDIVEIAFSFIGVPVKGGGFRVMLNLRALTLITSDFREEAEAMLKCNEDCGHPMPKRKRLYLQKDDEALPAKVRHVERETDDKDDSASGGNPAEMQIDE